MSDPAASEETGGTVFGMADGDAYFQVQLDREASPVSVVASGELDAASSPELSSALDAAVAAGSGVALDLRAVTFIDSSGLRVITAALRDASEADHRFTVSAASESVRRIFEITGLTALLEA